MANYENLINVAGEIRTKEGQKFKDPTALAGYLGIKPHEIQWGQIAEQAPAAPSAKLAPVPSGPTVETKPSPEPVVAPTTLLAPDIEISAPPVSGVNYANLENRNGTIYNTATGQAYSSPEQLAQTLGIQPHRIDWTQIKPASVPTVKPVLPTGNVIGDQHITEINQTIQDTPQLFTSGVYEPTLLEIYEARQDVKDEAERLFPGQNATITGTEANTWLNNWYNRIGKEEGADMVAKGILGPTTETGTPIVNTKDVEDVQDEIDKTVSIALEARDDEDYIALKTAMDDLKVLRKKQQTVIDQLYEDQKTYRQQYLDSLKPTAIETDLQSQLTDVRSGIDQTVLNAQAGIDKVTGQPIPAAFVTGQAKAIADAANLTLQTQGVQEKNLIDRLGIEVGARLATTEALAAGLGFISEDLNLQEKITTRLDTQEQNLLDRFDNYTENQKKDAVDILNMLSGVNPDTFDSTTLATLSEIANQRGIGLQDILGALRLQFDQVSYTESLRERELEPGTEIIEVEGRQHLINIATGELIKDLGPVEVEGIEGDENRGKTVKVGDDVFMWNSATGEYDIPVGAEIEPGQVTEEDAASIEVLQDKIGILDSVLIAPNLDNITGTGVDATAGFYAHSAAGTTQDTILMVQQILSKETIDTLIALKARGGTLGALSDQERVMLQSAATSIGASAVVSKISGKVIGYQMTEEAFNKEIHKIKDIANRAITRMEGTGTAEPGGIKSINWDFSFGGGGTPIAVLSGGMRTDRHNNPTAFTTDIAKMALTEGVEYSVGDPFPNNPKLKTATLLGDPVDLTIKVIDKIGFYTGVGKQRWTHTAMSDSKWNKLSKSGKVDIIKKMYQKEGNRGVLNQYFA